MASRGARAQQKILPPQWPPPVWPPVGYDYVPPELDEDDNAEAAEAPTFFIGGGSGTPIERALGLLADTLDAPEDEDDPYVEDPEGWVRDVLGEFMWSKQREIARSVRDNRRTAVPSAHETGKSWLAARIIAWFLSCHKPGEAFAVTTAPSASQVRAILWREINRAHKKGNLPGRTNQTEWWIGDEMVGFGRKPADYSPTAFQGIHAKHVLVVLDEACGIPEDIWRAAQSLIANTNGRMLAIGNPDDPTSFFARICGPDTGWNIIPVSAFDTPNFTGEPVPEDLAAVLVSHIYTDELAADVGEDSPVYISKALGRFPDNAANGVIPLSFIRECQRLDRDYHPDQLLPVELGMDVGAGGDETVIRERRGLVAGRTWRFNTPDWATACGHLMRVIAETGATRVKIDVIGIGWGVVGRMRELYRKGRHRCEVVPVDVRQTSFAPQKSVKLRDQIWWEIGRELSRAHAWDLSAVDDTTVAQLIAPTWQPDSAGRVQVEAKLKTKERIRRSPDDADALLLAFYVPPPKPSFKGAAGGVRMGGLPQAQPGRVLKLLGQPPQAAPARRKGNRPARRPAARLAALVARQQALKAVPALAPGRALPNPYGAPRRTG
jgi:hypothetical protein